MDVERQGCEVIPGLFRALELVTIVDALNDKAVRRSRAGIRNAFQIEAVRKFACDDRLLNLARTVLGSQAVPFRATLFDKSPTSNWLVVWHQDTALPIREHRDVPGWGPWSHKEGILCAHAPASALEQVLAIRIHLDDSTRDNGPLRVLPATHNCGVLSDDAIHDLASKTEAVECLVPTGGGLLMRPLIVHASSKATARSKPRRVLHIEYAGKTHFTGGIQLASD